MPGHWEGDLIEGRAGKSQIGTLVERTTRFTMLVPLPDGRSAAAFAAAVTPVIAGLPDGLRRSLTWDQGKEMGLHRQIAVAADCEIYFCDRVCQIFCARGLFAVRFRVFIRNRFLALSDAVLPGLSRGSAEPDFPCRSGADAACPGFPGVLCCRGRLLPDPPGIAWRAVPVCH